MAKIEVGDRVRYQGRTGFVSGTTIPGARRIGGDLRLTGEPYVTVMFADGTAPPEEVIFPESEWSKLEVVPD